MSFFSLWIKACRPKTLIASIAPIIVAAENFFSQNGINYLSMIVLFGCFVFLALIQISTNLANDYFDSKTGADCYRANAPVRYVASGQLKGEIVLKTVYLLMLLSFFVGITTLLVADVSVWFVLLGLICIALSVLYTGGPFPLAYNGLGDVFVIFFFGLVAVEGTTYFLTSANAVPYEANIGSALAVGFLINNLLVVNNYRDYESDAKVGKNTSIVKFGKNFGITLFFLGFLLPAYIAFMYEKYLVCMICLPSLISWFFLLKSHQFRYANHSLSFSAISVLLFSIFWVFP